LTNIVILPYFMILYAVNIMASDPVKIDYFYLTQTKVKYLT